MTHHPYIKSVSFEPSVPAGYTVWAEGAGFWRFTNRDGSFDSPVYDSKEGAQAGARVHAKAYAE
jgi:hypothetical protein